MKRILFTFILVAASLAFLAAGSWGAEFCVDPSGGGTHIDLQSALTAAQTNAEDDVIKVVQGSYTGNFTFDSAEGHSITLLGGFTSGCTDRVVDPANTILDAGGSGSVLFLRNSDGGNIFLEGFTLQNGNSLNDAGGVHAWSWSDLGTAGNVTLTNNTITGNTASVYSGGVYAYSYSGSSTAGNVTLTNNTIAGNTAREGGGGCAISGTNSGTAGDVLLTNNTITGNTATSPVGGVIASSYSNGPGPAGHIILTNNTITGNIAGSRAGGARIVYGNTVNIYNNIIWGNTALWGGDIHFDSPGTTYGYNNNYSDMFGSWDNSGGNVDEDPLFVDPGTGDFHLQAGSPCINAGTASAPSLPTTDCDGEPRISGSAPEIGADEVQSQTLPVGGGGSGGKCFIATATYGSALSNEVKVFRQFRDEYLLSSVLGRAFVSVYYKHSPPLADFIAKHPMIRKIMRIGLYPMLELSKWFFRENRSK